MLKRKLSLLALGLILGSVLSVHAASNQGASELDQKLVGLKTFEANFAQSTVNDKGVELSYAVGQIKLKRPSKIYWNSQEPDAVVIVSNGDELFHYDIELEQITKQPVANALSSSPALLIISGEPLSKGYHIQKLQPSVCKMGSSCYELKPKAGDKGFSWMQVGFNAKQELIYFSVLDNLSQLTTVKFTQTKVNAPIKESIFNFKVPSGVDVIDSSIGKAI